jgi:hypothetical protein
LIESPGPEFCGVQGNWNQEGALKPACPALVFKQQGLDFLPQPAGLLIFQGMDNPRPCFPVQKKGTAAIKGKRLGEALSASRPDFNSSLKGAPAAPAQGFPDQGQGSAAGETGEASTGIAEVTATGNASPGINPFK